MMTAIRPDLKVLRNLPTIHQVAETWGRLELKLETEDTRYWVTTQGVSRKTGGTPLNYVVDYITVEKRSDDGNWDLKAVYSPEAWKLSQAYDYSNILVQDLLQLNDQLESEFSWDVVGQIEKLEKELVEMNTVIRNLTDQVRSGRE